MPDWGGGWNSEHYFHFRFPQSILQQGKHINQFELYTVMIATQLWAPSFAGMNILKYCDNETTVQVLQTGDSNSEFSQCCLHEIRYHAAKFNFRI